MKTSTPNIAILIIVTVLTVSGVIIYLGKQKPAPTETAGKNLAQTIPETPTLAATAEFSMPSAADSGLVAGKASAIPVPSPALSENYVFAGSKIIRKTETGIEMESTADPSEITNWYKEKIKSLDFNARSFTQTSTNGTILNKLSAAKPGEKIDITIKKDQNISTITITVDRS